MHASGMDIYDGPTKGTKPIPGGSTEEEYRRVMHKIMEGLTKDNLDTILFLCKDHIPHGREIKTPLHFLKFLEDRDHVSQDSVVFIAEILHIIRRMDLLKIIPCIKNKKHFETEYLAFSYSWFSNYRVLTVQLQDELSVRDFETFRYQSSQHLQVRTLDTAANVLSLIRKLEEEDIISSDNYEELINILECIENVKPLKMFQRLLDGDECVAVPASKQMHAPRSMSQEVGFASRRVPNIPNIPQRSDWTDRNTRVEVAPGYMPPPYSAEHAGIRPYDTFEHQTDAKYHDEKHTIMYEFNASGNNVFAPSLSSSKTIPSEESTPKSVFGTEPMPGHSPAFMSMQPQYPYRHEVGSNNRDFESMPGHYGMQSLQYGGQPFHSLHQAASYPQNIGRGNQGQFQPQRQEPNYPIQQQISNDAPRVLMSVSHPSHARHFSYPHSMPPHLVSPPEGKLNLVNEVESRMQCLSTTDDNDGSFIAEDTPPSKASSSLEHIDNKPELGGLSPEHKEQLEELQKLKDIIYKQRNLGSYKMDSSPVGLCVLINNVNFVKNRKLEERERRVRSNSENKNNASKQLGLPRIDLSDRIGSDADADKLEKLFECFDFEVQRHNDLDQRGINKVIKESSEVNHDAYDCFLLIVLSHGDNGCVFGVDGFFVKICDIQQHFFPGNCPTLANKPKIFIIQACQGTKAMTFYAPTADRVDHDGPGAIVVESTPSKADFLIAYSTVPGFLSYRSRDKGTHFIRELIMIFKKHYEHEDLLSMMIKVNSEVIKYAEKQIPMPVPTLTKKVFFSLKKGCVLPEDEDENQEKVNQAIPISAGDEKVVNEREESIATQESGEQID